MIAQKVLSDSPSSVGAAQNASIGAPDPLARVRVLSKRWEHHSKGSGCVKRLGGQIPQLDRPVV